MCHDFWVETLVWDAQPMLQDIVRYETIGKYAAPHILLKSKSITNPCYASHCPGCVTMGTLFPICASALCSPGGQPGLWSCPSLWFAVPFVPAFGLWFIIKIENESWAFCSVQCKCWKQVTACLSLMSIYAKAASPPKNSKRLKKGETCGQKSLMTLTFGLSCAWYWTNIASNVYILRTWITHWPTIHRLQYHVFQCTLL